MRTQRTGGRSVLDPGAPVKPVVPAKVRLPQAGGLVRSRLFETLGEAAARGCGSVVAPAGTGKTTLLAQFADRTSMPCGWYRAERSDGSEADLLRHLGSALGRVLPHARPDWASVEEALVSLEGHTGGPVLLLVDDLHELAGTPAVGALDRLLAYRPGWLSVLIAARRPPEGVNMGRLRVDGDLVEIGSDELRFRSWEVEDLFRDVYGQPLPPEDAATLTRRTEGWAAGLKLFHLATTGRSAVGRHGLLHSLGASASMVRDYLAREVLAGVPADLRRFLVRTCVLGRLDGRLCDALLDGTGSDGALAELQRRELFLIPSEDGISYRYHEALRAHLEVMLVEEVGEAEARSLYQRAGRLLHEVGATPQALLAYCRGEDWLAVERLLGTDGEELTGHGAAWLERLPRHLADHDPWLLLVAARRHVASGSWASAVELYSTAERKFGDAAGAAISARERTMLSAWLQPLPSPMRDWSGLLRTATQRRPLEAHDEVRRGGSGGHLLRAVTATLGGDVRRARQHADAVLDDPLAEPVVNALARVVRGIAGWLGGDEAASDLREAADACEQFGLTIVSRLCRAVLDSAKPGRQADVARIQTACDRDGDLWGGALVALLHGLALLRRGQPAVEPLEAAADTFTGLGARVLASWATAGRALALASTGDGRAAATVATAAAVVRRAVVPGAHVLVRLAEAHTVPEHAEALVREARRAATDLGLSLDVLPVPSAREVERPTLPAPQRPPAAPAARRPQPAVRLRCFGTFEAVVDGAPLDESGARPQVATLLRLLAVHPREPIHRERLIAALWPDVDASRGMHRLHVAVSALRKLLSHTSALAVHRDGPTYHLAVPEDADVDLLAFRAALDAATDARRSSDARGEVAALRQVLSRYTDELMPEVGAAEWIVEERDRYRAAAAESARRLAELVLSQDRPEVAARICARGLRIDRYHDRLWRLAIAAHERAGHAAAAARLRDEYRLMLDDLGVTSPV